MERIIWMVLEYSMGLAEILIFYTFMVQKFKLKAHSSYYRIGLLGLGSILIYVISMRGVPILIGSGTVLIITLAIATLLFEEKWSEKLSYIIIFLLMVYTIDFVVVNVSQLIVGGGYDFNEATTLRIQLATISKLVLLVVIKYFDCLKSNRGNASNSYVMKYTYGNFVISLASIIALSIIFFELIGSSSSTINLCLAGVTIGVFFGDMMVYDMIQKVSDGLSKEKEYEIVAYQNELLIAATLEKDEMNKEARKLWHDFNNHISCIDMLLQMGNIEKARHYIKGMNESCQSTYMGIRTGNEIADAVINQKFVRAQAHQINMEIKGELSEELAIKQIDLCALLSNSLDNAIEACMGIKDASQRKIRVNMKHYKNNMLIEVMNTTKEEACQNKSLITTKKDKKRHGIGMLSMRTIVEKYGGNLEWKCEKSQFVLSIIIGNTIY